MSTQTHSRRSQLATAIPILLAFAVLAGFEYFYFPGRQLDSLLEAEKGRDVAVTKLAAHSVRPALAFDDPQLAADLLQEIANEHEAQYLAVLREGRLYARGVPSKLSPPRAMERSKGAHTQVVDRVLWVEMVVDPEATREVLVAGFSLERLLSLADGNRRNALWIAFAIMALGMIMAAWIRSFTARIEQLRAHAENANAAKSRFVANVSHELRTPLNGVLGMAEILGATALNARQRDLVSWISRSGHVLLETINDLLDFSKVEAGRIDIESMEVDVVQLVEDTLKVLSLQAREKNIDLSFEVKAGVPRKAKTDPLRLRQVVTNLISNALKFTSEGSVVVAIECVAREESRALVDVSVQDSGIGMNSAQMARLFQPFMQADASVTRKFGGTGLGLALVRRLVELNGGDVRVQSHPGAGSTFTFTWPLTNPEGSVDAQQIRAFQMSATEEDPAAKRMPSHAPDNDQARTTPSAGHLLLVVDDNPTNLEVAQGLLEMSGHRVHTVGGGRACLERLASGTPYAALLLDCQMPDLDGFRVARTYRETEPAGQHLPIIAMTASPGAEERAEAVLAGMDTLIGKPLSSASLNACLSHYLPEMSVTTLPAPDLDHMVIDQLRTLDAKRPGLLARVLGRYRESSVSQLTSLREAVAQGDAMAVRSLAHRLKGDSLSLGVACVAEYLAALEQGAAADDLTDSHASLQALEEALTRVKPQLLSLEAAANQNGESLTADKGQA